MREMKRSPAYRAGRKRSVGMKKRGGGGVEERRRIRFNIRKGE